MEIVSCYYGANVTTCIMMFLSKYPPKRVRKTDDGTEEGVVGSVESLQNITLSDQPISNLDWNTDKVNILFSRVNINILYLFLFIGWIVCVFFIRPVSQSMYRNETQRSLKSLTYYNSYTVFSYVAIKLYFSYFDLSYNKYIRSTVV